MSEMRSGGEKLELLCAPRVRLVLAMCWRKPRSCKALTRLLAAIAVTCFFTPWIAGGQSATRGKPSPAVSNGAHAAGSGGGYRIAGIVVSKIDGRPLSRAQITVRNAKDEQQSESVITDEGGRFEFRGVPAGKYSLHGAKRGFIASYFDQHENYWTAIVTGAGVDTENLVLKLAPSAVIAGHVLDESGDPVRGARLTLYRVDHSEGVDRIEAYGNTQSDDQGAYETTPLDAGTYFVSATAQPWYAVHPQPDGTAKAGTSEGADSSDRSSDRSSFDQSLDVTYPVTYYADTTDTESATPIPIRGGERLQVDFHLNPVPGLRLIFHIPGNERSGFTFPRLEQPAFDGSTNVETGGLRMISPGVVEMAGVPAGRYNVRIQGQDGVTQMNGVDLTQDGEEINTSTAESLSDVRIAAKMSDGSPLPKQLVVGLTSRNRFGPGGTALDEKGQAEVPQVVPGRYGVAAWSIGGKQFSVVQMAADGAEVTGHSVTITAGAAVTLSLTLSEGSAEVEGTVKHAGKAFAGAMVVLVPKNADGNYDLFRRDQSDLDGTFALHNVIPGSYTLVAIEDGWDLDWSEPQVIAAYAKRGRAIQVRNGSNMMHVSQWVELQSK